MKRLVATLLKPKSYLARCVIALLLAVFVLGALGYMEPAKRVLGSESLTFTLGAVSLSAYQLAKGLLVIISLLWIASIVSSAGKKYIGGIRYINASNRALIIKAFQVSLYFLVFLIVMDVVGIDLTTFAVVGGAIGIGIGFGLQKITSNFISGLILLGEKSIENDDLVELSDGAYGFIRHTGARYTLIETFDGKEMMIPNEDFITNRVTNWTYSNSKGRVEITIGVSYASDIERARELMLEAATEHPRCAAEPEPNCFLSDFADSSVNFVLYFWVDDVTEGRMEPRSDVMRAIWRKFNEHDIEIPYPQRDIHIKNPEALS